MCTKLVLQFTILALIFCYTQQANVATRIVGGVAVTGNNYRYYVRLHYGGGLRCGGSLVRNNVVITAAHCVKGVSASTMTIHADTINLSKAGVTRKVKRVEFPSSFSAKTMKDDVAVLILASAIPSNSFKAITLDQSTEADGTNCLIIGHGLTSENGSVASQLQQATVSIVNEASCKSIYSSSTRISVLDTMICAANPGKDACNGDSGGPLVCNGKLTGIVSFGIGCARARYPGVYTNVSKLRSFILNTISKYA